MESGERNENTKDKIQKSLLKREMYERSRNMLLKFSGHRRRNTTI